MAVIGTVLKNNLVLSEVPLQEDSYDKYPFLCYADGGGLVSQHRPTVMLALSQKVGIPLAVEKKWGNIIDTGEMCETHVFNRSWSLHRAISGHVVIKMCNCGSPERSMYYFSDSKLVKQCCSAIRRLPEGASFGTFASDATTQTHFEQESVLGSYYRTRSGRHTTTACLYAYGTKGSQFKIAYMSIPGLGLLHLSTSAYMGNIRVIPKPTEFAVRRLASPLIMDIAVGRFSRPPYAF